MGDAPEEDFSSLSITDRLQHKSWKARVSAYEELSKFFRTCDEKEFNQYESYLKKIPLDANAVAQDTGLTTLINFVENAPNAARTRDSVLPAVVEKCISSSRAGTKSKTVELILLYIEVDTADPVVELVFLGLDAKQPKTIAHTVFTLKEIVRLYGCKTVTPKPILKHLPKLFGHSDKNVREEATKLTMEIYRWLGQAITPYLADLNPIKIKELEEGFSKLPSEKPVAERLLRSQQAAAAEAAAGPEGEAAENEKEEEEVDSYDLVDPVDILAKMPADFNTNLASSKWKDRKEALDGLLEVVKTPKILDNNYNELVGALGKRMTDANILCVTVAANCIEAIALGLRTTFGKYKSLVVGPMIEKLKERKATVIEALSGALDATFESVSFQEILEDITTGANHKNPQVKAEIVKALSRRLKTIKEIPPKGEIKILAEMLMKTYDDSDGGVREASAEALGTLMKVAGEKTMIPWTEKLDDIKSAKVKEFFDKAEVKAKAVVAKKPAAPPSAPAKAAGPSKKGPSKPAPPKLEDTDDKENEAPKAAPAKPKAPAKAAAPVAAKKSAPKPAAAPSAPAKKGKSAPEEPLRYRFTPEDAEARTSEYIPENIIGLLASSNWKERLAGLESLYTNLESDPNTESEIIFRALGKKPGWKESNFQVMGKVFAVFEILASNSSTFSKACAAISINGGMLEKLGDIKLKKAAGDCLTVFVEKTSLQFILSQAYEPWKKAKSPKVLADSLIWLHAILMDFGIGGVNVRDLVEFLKTALGSSNASVRTNAVTVFGALRLYIGPEVKSFVQDVNPTLLATIEAEFAKVAEMEPPKPTKQMAEGDADDGDAMDQLFPRVDIGPQLTSKLLEECNDGNWKVRKEGLEKVVAIIEAANKRIKPNLGDFTGTLKARLNDSNKNLQVMALEITATIAIAMDKPFEKYVRIVAGPVTAVLTDNKANIRAAGITTLESFRKVCGLDPMITSFGTSLNTDNPALRKDLLTWLSECFKAEEESEDKLPDLTPLVPGVIACLQDRSADVRKAAQASLGPIISNVSYDYVISKTSDLKGAARQTVIPLIDAARPANAVKQPAPAVSQEKAAKPAASTKEAPAAGPKSKLALKKNAASAIKQPASSTPTPPSEPADDLALIQTSDPKAKNARAQKDAGPMKWNIEASRKDMIDFLSQQMEGNFNTELCRLLFSTGHHADKDYINSIQMIDSCIVTADEEMKSRIIANSDLILKYMTVRFFDTNTSMLIKCLDLLEHLVLLLEQEEYHLIEYEASCFLPFFVQKVGDSKEIMRQRIRGILKSICKIYPASKMFSYVLNHGLISKNARTRSESLEELGALIQRNGISVMVAKKDLPIVASHIGDRDASVRNAAIGAITQAYMLMGDQVLKCLGDLSDKDRSLLEERLKRTKPPPPNPTPANGATSGIKPPSAVDREPGLPKPQAGGQTRLQFQRLRPPSAVPPPPQSSEVEEEDYDQRKDFSLELDKLDLPQMSNAARTEIPAPMRGPATGLPTPQIANKSRTVGQPDNKEYMMDYIVAQITSEDSYQSIEALKHLDKILNSSPELVAPLVNELVNAITLQVRIAYSSLDAKSAALTRLCKHLVNALVLLFSNKELAIMISQDALHQLLQELAHRLLDQNMLGLEPGPQLSKALNVAMVKVLENSNRNATFSALLTILEKSSANLKNLQDDPMAASQAKFTELIMKCLWKLAKTIQENLKSGALVPNVLLLDINNFFNSAPPSEWKRRAAEKVPLGEMPLRTVKTLLLEMVNGLGDEVFVKMDLISDPQRSCVYPYLHHMWEACKKKERGIYDDSKTPTPSRPSSIVSNGSVQRSSAASPARPSSPHSPMRPNVVTPDLEMRYPDRPSSIGPKPHTSESTSSTTSNGIREAEMNNLLTQIFVKIGTREQTKQGIYELYQFQKKYPNAEAKVSAHLAQTGTYFQSYIRRGLTNLAAEETGQTSEGDSQPAAEQTLENTNGHAETTSDTQSETYKQKLARLQSMFGYRSESVSSISSTGSSHTRTISSEYGEPISPITSSAPPLYTTAATTTAELDRAQTVSALKERLARMKSNMNAVSSNP